MKLILYCLAFTAVVSLVIGLPVTKTKKEEEVKKEETKTPEQIETYLEYERYLKEVVEALESDPEFRKKLDKAPEADIRTGKIAQELDYVNHNVRTKLDEIKRREIERLRSLANKQFELSNDIDRDHLKIPAHHLDHTNYHTFEIDDLRKLILKTSEDLVEADKKRREEFKQYELQKEFEKQSTIKELDDEHRKKYEKEIKEKKEKHNKHEKMHHPGNKAQLEEVWEKQDHMDKNEFDKKTFFMLHDVDGNGFWDETEVKALFIKELDKVYQSGVPEDDMRERAEEMERMREHVYQETDSNHDGLISYQEFLAHTEREEFKKDPGWETVDNEPQFTHEEYLEFERKRQEEIQRLIAQGAIPPHQNMPNGYYPNEHGGYQSHPGVPNPGQQNVHYAQQGNQQQQHQQQQVYQQQQQHINYQPQPGHPVQLNQNQVYQHVPQQQVYQQAQHPGVGQQQQVYQQQAQPQQAYHQQPQQPYQQQVQPQQQYQQQSPPQQINPQQAVPNSNPQVPQQGVPIQQQPQVASNPPPKRQQVQQQAQQQAPQQPIQQQVPQHVQQQVPQHVQQQVPQHVQQQVPQHVQQQIQQHGQQQIPQQVQQQVPQQVQQKIPQQVQQPAQQQVPQTPQH